MNLFTKQYFDDGQWAGALATMLRQRRVVADKKTVARVWRATWKQWVQCEPKGVNGAAFWFGKPAVISWGDTLYSGYYVERGYAADAKPEYVRAKPDYIMDSGWHWHLFMKTLKSVDHRDRLNDLMSALPASRRCVWLLSGEQDSIAIEYR